MKTVLKAFGVIAALCFCWVAPAQAVMLGGTWSGSSTMAPNDSDIIRTLVAFAQGWTHTSQLSDNTQSGSNSGWTGEPGGTQTNRATTVYALFADANNSLFGTGTSLCSLVATGAAFAATCASGASTFSLTQQDASLPKAGYTSSLAQVPEPGTLFLLGSAMAALGALRRRRTRAAQ
jgi:PEP-CTERM motif